MYVTLTNSKTIHINLYIGASDLMLWYMIYDTATSIALNNELGNVERQLEKELRKRQNLI